MESPADEGLGLGPAFPPRGRWDRAFEHATSRFRAFYGATEAGQRWHTTICGLLDRDDQTPVRGPIPLHPAHAITSFDLSPLPDLTPIDTADRAAIALGALGAATGELRALLKRQPDLSAWMATEPIEAVIGHLEDVEDSLASTTADPLAALLAAVHARGLSHGQHIGRGVVAKGWSTLTDVLDVLTVLLGGTTMDADRDRPADTLHELQERTRHLATILSR